MQDNNSPHAKKCIDHPLPFAHIQGMEKLQSYLKNNALTQSAFADMVGLGASDISRLASGKMMPSLKSAVAIQAATGNAVEPKDWIADPQTPRAKSS